jgi:uncharacterized membrane protein
MEGLLIVLGLMLVFGIVVTPILLITLSSRVSKLEEQVKTLKLREYERGTEAVRTQRQSSAESPAVETPKSFVEPVQATIPPRRELPTQPPQATSPVKAPPSRFEPTAESKVSQFIREIESAPRRENQQPVEPGLSLEELVGGKWLTWVGSLAVILGAGFFFKYAIDMGWIGPMERVVIGLVVGCAVFGGGVWGMLRDYRWLAMGLVGAAAGILYFDLWAAAKQYELVSIPVAFTGMVIVTVATLLFSLKFDAQPTAILGLVGGYLTPLVLSTGVDAQWFFFSYLLLLDLGVLAMSVTRHWRPLQHTAFGGTLLLWLTWFANHYESHKLEDTVILMSAFFALFVLLGLWRSMVRRLPAEPEDSFLIIVTPIVYFATLYAITLRLYSDWHGWMSCGMALIYAGLTWCQWRRHRADLLPAMLLGGIGITFLILAVPLHFTGHWVPIAWALLSLVLVEAGLRCRQPKLLSTGMCLLLVVQVVLMIYAVRTFQDPVAFQTQFSHREIVAEILPDGVIGRLGHTGRVGSAAPAWSDAINGRSLSFLASGIVIAIIAWEFRRKRPDGIRCLTIEEISAACGTDSVSLLGSTLSAVPLTVLALFIVEIFSIGGRAHWIVSTFLGVYSVLGSFTALALMFLSRRLGPQWVQRVSMAVFGMVAVLLAISSLITIGDWPAQWQRLQSSSDAGAWRLVLLNPRGLGFLLTTVAAGAAAWLAAGLVRGESDRILDPSAPPAMLLGIYAYITGLLMLTTEVYAFGWTHGWDRRTSLAITATWTLYAIATLLVGIRVRSSTTRILALTLFLVTTGKVFLHDVWYLNRGIRTLAFTGLGVSLLLVSWLYRRHRDRIQAWITVDASPPVDEVPAVP